MRGLDAADAAGLKIKINMVAMRGINEDEIDRSASRFAHGRGFGLTLIEGMPLGEVDIDRVDQYLPLYDLRERLLDRFTLRDIPHRTGGPARYVGCAETGGLLGFITPMSHNFCESCNRVRLTAPARSTCASARRTRSTCARRCARENDAALHAAIDDAMRLKPKGHDFVIDRRAPPGGAAT